MTASHYSVREVWEFEKFMASKPHVWQVEAWNLRCSAEVLCKYETEVSDCIFNKKIQPPLPPFFSARVARMLMGFSLENLIKAVLLQNPAQLSEAFRKDGNLSWGKDGHNLLSLSAAAQIEISALDKTYLELWQLCALWAGRYPIAMKEHDMPRQRVALPNRADLIKRAQKRFQKAVKNGDPLMGVELSDLLHGGISSMELGSFKSIYDRCNNLLQKAE